MHRDDDNEEEWDLNNPLIIIKTECRFKEIKNNTHIWCFLLIFLMGNPGVCFGASLSESEFFPYRVMINLVFLHQV
jgi:hypothetical protein